MTNELLDLLRCPACRGELSHDEAAAALICGKCGKRYRIEDGIPVMITDDSPGRP